MATSKSFGNLIKHVKSLPEIEQTKLFHLLRSKLKTLSATSGKMVQEMREKRFRDGTFCPHCNHDQVVRFGKTDNKQRYRCKGCKKTFNDFTKSVFAKTHKNEEWVTFFDCMLKGFSLRRSAEICDVHFVTLFYWRHKILHALQQIEIPSFEGIVEADETHFLESQKGKKGISARPARKRGGKSKYRGVSHEQVCVLVARDRSKTTLSKVVGFGHVNANQLDKTLSPKMSNENVLVSDAWRAYQKFAKSKGLEHIRIKSSDVNHSFKGIFHIQNINGFHARLKKWMDRFNGVSTKYLENYLAWFCFLDAKGNEATIGHVKEMILKAIDLCEPITFKSIRTSVFQV